MSNTVFNHQRVSGRCSKISKNQKIKKSKSWRIILAGSLEYETLTTADGIARNSFALAHVPATCIATKAPNRSRSRFSNNTPLPHCG
jgi:hypothetical protein